MISKNNRTIDSAFSRLMSNKHERFVGGLKGLLEEGLNFALMQHEVDGHENHLTVRDSYGWAIGHNGRLVEISVAEDGVHGEVSVSDMLKELVSQSSGYTGFIMAGMQPYEFYAEDYERDYLKTTAYMVETDFYRYFKKI